MEGCGLPRIEMGIAAEPSEPPSARPAEKAKSPNREADASGCGIFSPFVTTFATSTPSLGAVSVSSRRERQVKVPSRPWQVAAR